MSSSFILLSITLFPFLIYISLVVIYHLQRQNLSLPNNNNSPSLNLSIAIDENLVSIVRMEFDYISKTASEAMSDRHKIISFYLGIVAVVITGVLSILSKGAGLPVAYAVILLWGGYIIGLFYFLKIIRLRQAWLESVQAMNEIKSSFIIFSKPESSGFFKESFRWTEETIPKVDQKYNVFHYSAMLIGFFNASGYIAGALLLYNSTSFKSSLIELLMLMFFIFVFYIHHLFYSKFLG